MTSTEDNILDHNFLVGLNEDHDILDEFLDQRVYDSIGTNTPTSGHIKLENEDLLDSMYPSATANYNQINSNPHSINNSHSNSRFNLHINGLQDSNNDENLNGVTSGFPHLQNNNDYLYVDSNYPEISTNSIYTSPFEQKTGSTSNTSNNSISKEKISNNSISDYDYVRDELNKLKYGTRNMNPCPDSVNMPDPSKYLDFSPQTMASLPYNLQIANLPTYSRVETQIKIKFTLSPPPPHVLLHIPQDLISKNKFCLNELMDSLSPKLKENLLFMDAYVLTSDTHKSCNICVRCIKREQRRASRRKANDGEGNNSNNETTYSTPVANNGGVIKNNPNSWADESMKKKAIIFNCKEVVSFPPPTGLDNDLSKSLELSARIICYCRHHKESEGFKLLFVLKNSEGQIVAKQLTSPIMIMDRKKNTNSKFESTNSVAGSSTNLKDLNDTNLDDDDDEYEHKLSFSKKNSISNSDIAKSYALARTPSIMSPQLEMHARTQSQSQHQEDAAESDLLSSLHPLSPNSIDESASEPLTNTDTNTNSDMRGTKRKKLSFDDSYNNSTNPMFNGSASGFSPMSNSDTNTSTTNHMLMKHIPPTVNPMNSNFGSFSGLPRASGSQQQETLPSIQRIIPAQGSIRGGIEVTLLGFNFRPGLVVKFGANQALATHCWSETTIVTYLPPAAQPGQVLVSFENQEDVLYGAGQQKQIFTYTDDTDRQLIELALQIVGLKMNGKLEDAKNIAKRIVGSDNNSTNGNTNGIENANIQNNMNQANMDWFDNAHRAVQRLTKSDLSTEDILINFLSLVDLPNCPIIIPNWLLSNNQGQSLMHISTMKNYTNLIKFLITHGCKIDVQDNQGLTPLFLASMCGHRDLIQIFIDCKSNWNLKLSNDRYLKDYCDLNVLDIFNKLEAIDESSDHNLILSRDEKLSKTLSLDSLNSMFTTSYGRHVSKMVMENSVDVDSSNSQITSKQVDRSFIIPATSQEESNSDYADSEYESNDYDDLDDEFVYSYDEEDDYYEDEADEVSTYSQDIAAENSGDETIVPESSESGTETPTGVWQKVKNIFTADEDENLPSYDDLFPFGPSSFHSRPKTSDERSLNHASKKVVAPPTTFEGSSSTKLQTTEDSQDEAGIASDSSEDMVISYINHPRKTFENDKMLIFFWVPALICILGFFFMVSVMGLRFEFIENIKVFVRDTLGNIMVGNERIGRVFNTNNGMQKVLDATTQLVS